MSKAGFDDDDGGWVWQSSSQGRVDGGPDDDGPDDGGLAGVREPRPPGPCPSHLFSERPLPGPGLAQL